MVARDRIELPTRGFQTWARILSLLYSSTYRTARCVKYRTMHSHAQLIPAKLPQP